MFVEVIKNIDEKTAYIETLVKFAGVDGKIHSKEKEYIRNVAIAHGVPEDTLKRSFADAEKKQYDKIVAPLRKRRQKLLLISDLVGVGYADGEYTDIEKQEIQVIGKHLDIEAKKIEEIEEITFESLKLRYKTMQVMEMYV